MTEASTPKLETLFEFAPPARLRKSLHHIFFSYLTRGKEHFPEDFEQIVSDLFFLLHFLDEAETG